MVGGAMATVSVAELLVTLPAALVITHRNRALLSYNVVEDIEYVDEFAEAMLSHVVPPLLLLCHW